MLVIWRPTKSNHSWCATVTQIRALEVATLRPFWPLAFLQGKGTSWVAPAVSLFICWSCVGLGGRGACGAFKPCVGFSHAVSVRFTCHWTLLDQMDAAHGIWVGRGHGTSAAVGVARHKTGRTEQLNREQGERLARARAREKTGLLFTCHWTSLDFKRGRRQRSRINRRREGLLTRSAGPPH